MFWVFPVKRLFPSQPKPAGAWKSAGSHCIAHPSPRGDAQASLQALIFDSYFDPYQGAISYIRVVSGQIRRGDMIKMMSNGKVFETAALGVISPYMTEVEA